MSNYEVTTLTDEVCTVGESPYYDPERHRLVCVDNRKGDLVIVDLASNTSQRHHVGDFISLVIPVKNETNKFLVTSPATEVGIFDLSTKQVTSIAKLEVEGLRFNDGKCDAKGRLWVGALDDKFDTSSPRGVLFRLDGNKFTKVADGFYLSNGITWKKANTKLYFADSLVGVYSWDFDLEKGVLSNRQLLVDLYKIPGFKRPDNSFLNGDIADGITIDAEDNVWVSDLGAGKLCKFDGVNGALLEEVKMPILTTTSAAFGGQDYTELYVTSIADTFWAESSPFKDKENYGRLFKVTNKDGKLKGLPVFEYQHNQI